MKKIIYTLIAVMLLLTSCINRDYEPDNVIGEETHPTLTFTAIDDVNGTTTNEGDALSFSYKATLSKPLSFNIHVSARAIGGTADQNDFTVSSTVIEKFATEAIVTITILPDSVEEETETLELELGAYNVRDKYEVRQIETTIVNLAIENCETCTTCDWTLDMQDAYGDAWNGAMVEFNQAGIATTYALDDYTSDGVTGQAMVSLANLTDVTVSFISGAWDSEVSFQLYDASGVLVLEVLEGSASAGELYSGPNVCP